MNGNSQLTGFEYIKTPQGILRIGQVVTNLIGTICVAATLISAKGNGFLACSVLALILTAVLLACYIFQLVDRIALPWNKIEFFYSVIWVLFFIIVSAIVISVKIGGYIAGGVFGLTSALLYAADAFFIYRAVVSS